MALVQGGSVLSRSSEKRSLISVPNFENSERQMDSVIPEEILSPSCYMKSVLETTCQWLENQRTKKSKKCPSDRQIFRPFPEELIFKTFTLNSPLILPLSFKNMDRFSRCLDVSMEESPFFKLISPGESGKIGPGLTVVYKVVFMANKDMDYHHCVTYCCEGMEYRIKIRAIGSRAIFDFPDRIDFQLCPVKYLSSKTVFIKNVGTCGANFILKTNLPFSVYPESGYLDINDNLQVTLNFYPLTNGNHCDHLILIYETGEKVCIKLFGISDDMAIRLDKGSLRMDDISMGTLTTKSVLLLNSSNVITSFKWSPFATKQEEEMHEKMLMNHLELSEMESYIFNEESCLIHKAFKESKPSIGETLNIDPIKGHIWPKSNVDMKITFKPKEPGEWKMTIYCDVEGRETRLPLSIEGFAIGPSLEFSMDHFDIGQVCVGICNVYEVHLHNEGSINAKFTIQEDISDLGSSFQITPRNGHVEQYSCLALQISFCRNTLGPFKHTVLVNVENVAVPLKLDISGSVEAPSFSFDMDCIDFEVVSLGFDKVKKCNVINTSLMSFEFHIHVSKGDFGDLNCDDIFKIEPSEGTLHPLSSIEINVGFRPRELLSYHCNLIFNVVNVNGFAFSLPILARALLPSIKVLTSCLNYNSIPVNFPVTKLVKLENNSDFSGKYLLEKLDTEILSCYSSSFEGVIEPLSCSIVPVTVVAKCIEEIQDFIKIYLPGSTMPLEVLIHCKGEGPVVTLSHEYLDWGVIPVLKQVSKSLVLHNHSPIPAQFKVQLLKSGGIWFANPMEGVIHSEGKVFLDIVVNLDDATNFSGLLEVFVENSTKLSCQMVAQGRGSTILLDPRLKDCIEFGPQYCESSVCQSFQVANCGRRVQSVIFKTLQIPIKKKFHIIKSKHPKDSSGLVLSIIPSRLELLPGSKSEITVTCTSNLPCYIEKTVLCQAIVGVGGSKEDVGELKFLCHFIDPMLKLSTSFIKFEVYKMQTSENEPTIQSESFCLTNVSSIAVVTSLTTDYPFFLSLNTDRNISSKLDLTMAAKECQELLVWFDPNFEQGPYNRYITKQIKISFQNHSRKDCLDVQGSVYYPNLEFERSSINFGCILNDTEATTCVTIFNRGPLPATYFWSFDKTSTTSFIGVPQVLQSSENDQWGMSHVVEGPMKFISPVTVLIDENKTINETELSAKIVSEEKIALDKPKVTQNKIKAGEQEENIFNKDYSQKISSKLIGFLPNFVQNPKASVEETFHVEPMFGSLHAGESETVTFVFHGYPHINCSTKAICNVFHGPRYEILLEGESSFACYEFNTHTIDYGSIHYNKRARGSLNLINTGKVALKFKSLISGSKKQDMDIFPPEGQVGAGCQQAFTVNFCPGSPHEFQYMFQIQVACFEPEIFHVRGNATFPRIFVDLPLTISESPTNDDYSNWLSRAAKIVSCKNNSQAVDYCDKVQIEAERLMFVSYLESLASRVISPSCNADFFLQDYIIDFGAISLATIVSKTVTIINPGNLDVSFYIDDVLRRRLALQGILINFSRICNLPPNCLANFEVTFDPRNSNFELNYLREELPIHVSEGPNVKLSIRCQVIMPNLCLSENNLNFCHVMIGECKIITIQLFNQEDIHCCWSLENKTMQDKKRKSKHSRANSNICKNSFFPTFDLIPSCGVVQANCKVNVQVKFQPKQEKEYQSHLVLVFEGSCFRQSLLCNGTGVERKVEIFKDTIEFGPILPNSEGDTKSLIIKNPTCYPVELYCLEVDEAYLMEEKVLRLLEGYDNFNNMLLPPRCPGEDLPNYLLKYYEALVREYKQSKAEETDVPKTLKDTHKCGTFQCTLNAQDVCETNLKSFREVFLKEKYVGSVKENPVMNVLSQYTKVNLEDDVECLKQGIVFIVHGSPKSGKSSLAKSLSSTYGAIVLNFDEVIINAIECKATSAGFLAYNECLKKTEGNNELSKSNSGQEEGYKDTTKSIKFSSVINTFSKDFMTPDKVERNYINLKNGTKLLTTLLPEDVLVTIFSERLMIADCLGGVIIDGLHSYFTESCQNTALILSKVFAKRQFIYAISLKLPFESVKKKQLEMQLYYENQLKVQEARTLKHLNEMSEDEFDNLTFKEQMEFNNRRCDFKKAILERKKTEEFEKRKHEIELEEEEKQKKGKKKNEKQGKVKDSKVTDSGLSVLEQSVNKGQCNSGRKCFNQDNNSLIYEDNQILEQRFILFENEFNNICNIYEFWDQTTNSMKLAPDEDVDHNKKPKKQNSAINKKERSKENVSQVEERSESPLVDFVIKEGSGITHIILNVSYQNIHSPYYTIMNSDILPAPYQVLKVLGLDRTEPDIPPPTIFSVVSYPFQRCEAKAKDIEYFGFVDDINDEFVEKQEKIPNSEDGGLNDEAQESWILQLKKRRWVIPAMSEIILKLWFKADQPKIVNSSLNFELVGNRKQYHVTLSGLCCYPAISSDPKNIFPICVWKSSCQDEIIMKKYVCLKNTFCFGPLLVGKTREKYKECVYPENVEKLNIINTSPFEAEVSFAFLEDEKEETFLLDTALMILCPGEEKFLHVWAYPKASGYFEDSLVCCIKDNPEPVVFKLSCQGVTPELEFDSELDFGGVLLHRKESRALTLKNKTFLPVTWRMVGLDGLGGEFSVCKEEGLVPALGTYEIWFHFKSEKPMSLLNKAIRLEVYDANKIIGLTQSENILISAEAYDVALDISFAKGSSGGIDFGLNKVGEEARQVCTLRNKGKYDISFNFELSNGKNYKDVRQFIFIDPMSGLLMPNDKPITIQLSFLSKKEISIKELPILKCFVIDSKLSNDSNAIASIPIKVSARSTWIKVKILPSKCLNFGALAVGTKKVMQISLENTGEKFSANYLISLKNISSASPITESSSIKLSKKKKISDSKSKIKKKDEAKSQEKLMIGIFCVYPSSGTIEPGSQAIINIECFPEIFGEHKEELVINIPGIETITGEASGEISYSLMAEFCSPRIEIFNYSLIFEEHFIERNIQPQCFDLVKHMKGVGFFKLNERKFFYNYLLLGSTLSARFKIMNIEKIPCNVTFSLKPFNESTSDSLEAPAFTVSPQSYQIMPFEHVFATVSFMPSSLKTYLAIFEASVDTKESLLTFELSGEGVLPHLRVMKPEQRNEFNVPKLSFKRIQVSQEESLPVHLLNDGVVTCNIEAQVIDPDNVFSICLENGSSTRECLKLTIDPGETSNIVVNYVSQEPKKSSGKLKLVICENAYDEITIELSAESFKEEVYLQIPYPSLDLDQNIDGSEGCNLLHFGECGVGESHTLKFQMVNTLPSDLNTHFKFDWQCDIEELNFSPKMGHLMASSSKDIYVTFNSPTPLEISKEIKCNLIPITYDNKSDVGHWDDRLKVIKWIDNRKESTSHANSKVKSVCSEKEPHHTEIGDTKILTLNVIADTQYCQYIISTKTIMFKDTKLFETRTYKFKITNTGMRALKFNWDFVTLEDVLQSKSAETLEDKEITELGSLCSKANCPFTIFPECGTILSKDFMEFSVKFQPTSVRETISKFVCKIPNLEPGIKTPEMEIRGRCILPLYHFELESSNYLSQRNKKWLIQDLSDNYLDLLDNFVCEPSINVVEFSAIGINKAITKRFFLVNPTVLNHSFNWSSIDLNDEVKSSQFVCYTPSGFIYAGKRLEIMFVFTPVKIGIIESMWTFCLPELNKISKFLLVGKTREPNIFFEKSHCHFGPVMVANKCVYSVMLLNHEDDGYSYSIDPQSCFNAERNEFLCIGPMKGTLNSRSSSQITMEYVASMEGEVNFNVRFHISCMTVPLNLNVKAHGYHTKASLSYSKECGPLTKLRCGVHEEIDFGKVKLFDCSVVNISIENLGSLDFNFFWHGQKFDKPIKDLEKDSSMIFVKPISGFVIQGKTINCSVIFKPTKETTLKNVKLILNINHIESYHILLKGSTISSTLKFSSVCFNFGRRFIYKAGHEIPTAELVITNQGDRPASLNCLQQSDMWLSFSFEPKTINPNKSVTLKFKFYAREATTYHKIISFIIDEVETQNVQFCGEGIEIMLAVQCPKDKEVHLGAVCIGQNVRKSITVCNNNLDAVKFFLNFQPKEKELLSPGTLAVYPSGPLLIPGCSCFNVEICFSPKKRIASFVESITAESEYFEKTLFVISGAGLGLELALNMEFLNFGMCVLGSSNSQNLVLSNSGDIGSKFYWNIEMLLPDFEICPSKGYIPPGSNVVFKVTFKPKKIMDEFCCKVNCFTDYHIAPGITLYGQCTSFPSPNEVINIQTTVRKKAYKTLDISNPSDQIWNLMPVIDGEFFTGFDILVLPPKSNKDYEITYYPLVMTEKSRHLGNLFLPLPNGCSLMYSLVGTSDPPEVESQLLRNIPSRLHHSENLKVENWLDKTQRFKVIIQNVSNGKDQAEKNDVISGVDHIVVPALMTKEYQLSLFSYKQGSFKFKVFFMNKSKEYIFYELLVNFIRPDVIDRICIESVVRKKKQYNITIQNPLMIPATLIPSCTVEEICLASKMTIPGLMERIFTLEYFPLKPGKVIGKLELSSDELGLLIYDLELRATNGTSEKTIMFKTFLGSNESQTVKFINFSKVKTDYICEIDDQDFFCEKTISAPSNGCEVSVEIMYQPSKIGVLNSLMTATSPLGGQYKFPLLAECFSPKPQGPFILKNGSSISIAFKNVFKESELFCFNVDNPLFKLSSSSEMIQSQKEHKISISFKSPNAGIETGKLIVTRAQTNSSNGIQWIYYLKGISS